MEWTVVSDVADPAFHPRPTLLSWPSRSGSFCGPSALRSPGGRDDHTSPTELGARGKAQLEHCRETVISQSTHRYGADPSRLPLPPVTSSLDFSRGDKGFLFREREYLRTLCPCHSVQLICLYLALCRTGCCPRGPAVQWGPSGAQDARRHDQPRGGTEEVQRWRPRSSWCPRPP